MRVRTLLPVETALSCDSVEWNGNKITVAVSSVSSSSSCPRCGRSSERVHSNYVRRLADLPWQGLRVELHWQCRRFFVTVNGSTFGSDGLTTPLSSRRGFGELCGAEALRAPPVCCSGWFGGATGRRYFVLLFTGSCFAASASTHTFSQWTIFHPSASLLNT